MRQYKFRGKRVDNGEWDYGFLVIDQDGTNWIVSNFGESYCWNHVMPETVGQFTGQKYNKVELFEGDIVEIEYHDWALGGGVINPFNEDKSQKVIRLLCRFGVDSSFHLNRIDDGSNACYAVQFSGSAVIRKDIIGNSTDNPELLTPSEGGRLNTMTDPNVKTEEAQQDDLKASPATETEQEQVQGEETEG